ncbi:pepsin/retropepsin-like aspartic protease family protein [Pedobacter rhizosphaerae]|uniref:Aspartyl protease n=1 Tax=Pedobacter rhizosphaerae TaxID=390241 RepID=A0A1H9U1N4_9SPHI|nr:hypothetical protein [Pedobacter rhizosphaerae]SES03064.1 Aspartyl protease [Pedobacter rhizosphaerae]
MKNLILLFLVFLSWQSFAQNHRPIVNAISKKARIYEDDELVKGWNISPGVAMDVFSTNKLTHPKKVKFITDIDSIVFMLKPGQQKDFIVLLNGKDSCLTRIQSPEIKNFSQLKPEIHDSIPLIINAENTIYSRGILNYVDTLNLNFDTGTTELTLTNKVLTDSIKSKIKLYDTLYELILGKRIYKSKVYDAALSGHGTDGRFGWDLFDGMIVEINYDRGLLIIHSKMPKMIRKDAAFTRLNIKYSKQLLFVESEIAQGKTKNKDWFLFDTGYQRTVMLDNDLLSQNNFPSDKMEVINKVMMHGGTGNEVPVITSNLESLKIGRYALTNVPAQLLTTNKPMRGANIHILGNEILKRFNVIMDFQENVIYMKPNAVFRTDYAEKKKNG